MEMMINPHFFYEEQEEYIVNETIDLFGIVILGRRIHCIVF